MVGGTDILKKYIFFFFMVKNEDKGSMFLINVCISNEDYVVSESRQLQY